MVRYLAGIFFIFIFFQSSAQEIAADSSNISSNWCFNFQQTVIGQRLINNNFRSPYSGRNSVRPHDITRYSLTSTLFIGRKLWNGASVYFNPEIAGGSGLSSALGIAGATNGETFRIGSPAPALYVARLFFRQHINLSKNKEFVNADVNQVSTFIFPHRLTITAGKFSIADLFDDNTYSHDPRTEFFNWSLMSNGAWDYPANTRGYTYNVVLEYFRKEGAIRFASSLMPTYANGPVLDWNISKAHSETMEIEKPYNTKAGKGIIRLLFFHTNAHMGNYRETINTQNISDTLDITKTRKYGRTKFGLGINIEQALGKSGGLFFRSSWNDGKNETWAFTEIDHSISGGITLYGIAWKKPLDRLGAALVFNGISKDHREYLAKGGYGFMLGDGKLNYAAETILEIYYSITLFKFLSLSPDYQFIINPGYNRDRGPIHTFALRAHVEF